MPYSEKEFISFITNKIQHVNIVCNKYSLEADQPCSHYNIFQKISSNYKRLPRNKKIRRTSCMYFKKRRLVVLRFRKEIEMIKFLDTCMEKTILICLLLLVLLIYGCCIPDIPGPIGIPGI